MLLSLCDPTGYPDHMVFAEFRRRFDVLAPHLTKKHGRNYIVMDEKRVCSLWDVARSSISSSSCLLPTDRRQTQKWENQNSRGQKHRGHFVPTVLKWSKPKNGIAVEMEAPLSFAALCCWGEE